MTGEREIKLKFLKNGVMVDGNATTEELERAVTTLISAYRQVRRELGASDAEIRDALFAAIDRGLLHKGATGGEIVSFPIGGGEGER